MNCELQLSNSLHINVRVREHNQTAHFSLKSLGIVITESCVMKTGGCRLGSGSYPHGVSTSLLSFVYNK